MNTNSYADYGTERENTVRDEEILIPDTRANLSPAQMVEQKLVSIMKSGLLPVSHLQASQRHLRPQ